MVLFGNTLYYPGCLAKIKLNHIAKNYEKILTELGVPFITIKDIELCCGVPVRNAGYRQEFYDIVEKNKEIFANQKVTKIITNCPTCYRIFNEEYGIKTEHITQTIADNLHKLKKDYNGEKVTYHDPCSLRKEKIFDEPREILKAAGFDLIEMKRTKDEAMCCGAGGLLKANSPRIADKIAQLRLSQTMINKLITTCPLCYMHLKQNAKGVQVLELSEVLL